MRESFGRFKVLEPLGTDFLGSRYLAFDSRINRQVVLKTLDPAHEDPKGLVREHFLQEVRLAARLSHTNIVKVFGIYTEDESPYVVMENLEGPTLEEVLAESGALPPERVVVLLAPIADALDYAHAEGVIHRDIRPANVAIIQNDQPVLTGFGMAKMADVVSAVTRQGLTVGTPGYAAPELITGAGADQRADMFSFGVMLFEALTGRKPFEGRNLAETLHLIAHETPSPPSRLAPGLQPRHDRVVLRALAKRPEDRYTDMRTLGQELEKWLQPPGPEDEIGLEETMEIDSRMPVGDTDVLTSILTQDLDDTGKVRPEEEAPLDTMALDTPEHRPPSAEPLPPVVPEPPVEREPPSPPAASPTAMEPETPTVKPAPESAPSPEVPEVRKFAEPVSDAEPASPPATAAEAAEPPPVVPPEGPPRPERRLFHGSEDRAASPVGTPGKREAAVPREPVPRAAAPTTATRRNPVLLGVTAALVLIVIVMMIWLVPKLRPGDEVKLTDADQGQADALPEGSGGAASSGLEGDAFEAADGGSVIPDAGDAAGAAEAGSSGPGPGEIDEIDSGFPPDRGDAGETVDDGGGSDAGAGPGGSSGDGGVETGAGTERPGEIRGGDAGEGGGDGGDTAVAVTPPPVRTGVLEVASHPWSRVTIDGTTRGETPLRVGGLEEGDHRLVLTANDGRRWSTAVRIRPDRAVYVFHNFTEGS